MLSTPDFTPPAVISFLTMIVGACVVLFKLDLTDAQQGALITILGALYVVAAFLHDALVRRGRARLEAAHLAALAADPNTTVPPITAERNDPAPKRRRRT